MNKEKKRLKSMQNSRKIDKEVIRRVLENNKALNLPISDEIIESTTENRGFPI